MYELIRVHLITIFPGNEGVYELLEIIWYMEQNLQNLQLPVSIWKIIPTFLPQKQG